MKKIKYCAAEGTTSVRFSDDSWIQMCIREMGGDESIVSQPPWNFSP